MQNKDCLSLMEVSNLNHSCNASFLASVGEMFLPIISMHLLAFEEERMFIRSRICSSAYVNLVEDLICTGCQLCGAPLNSEFGYAFSLLLMVLSEIAYKNTKMYCMLYFVKPDQELNKKLFHSIVEKALIVSIL